MKKKTVNPDIFRVWFSTKERGCSIPSSHHPEIKVVDGELVEITTHSGGKLFIEYIPLRALESLYVEEV